MSAAPEATGRLLLLCIADVLGGGTRDQLMRFAVETGLMMPFRSLLATGELLEDGLLRERDSAEGRMLFLTPKGRQMLAALAQELDKASVLCIRKEAPHWKRRFRDERQLPAEWKEQDGAFLVIMRALEAGRERLHIEVPAADRAQAQQICRRWPHVAADILGAIMEKLCGDEERETEDLEQ